VVKVYEVPGESAYTGKHRKALDAVAADARKEGFDVLLTWALDRLSREGPLETLKLVDRFGRLGVRIVSLEEPWTEVANEMLDLLLAIAGWVARQDSKRKSANVKSGMERARAEGKHVGRPPRRRPVDAHALFPEMVQLVDRRTMSVKAAARRLRVREQTFREAYARRKGQGENDPSSPIGEAV
jgi:DNA invertase Pin-like site-specific DNA recombinase